MAKSNQELEWDFKAEGLTLEMPTMDRTVKTSNGIEDSTVQLSEQEQRMVEEFAAKIDLSNSSMILQYGAPLQKKIADFSESALANVKTKDMGEIGAMLADVVGELRDFDEKDEKGLFGFFKKSSNKINALKTRYDSALKNVDKIVQGMESHQIGLYKDVAILDKMYEMNKNYCRELYYYIIAGKKKLEQVHNEDLPTLQAKAAESGLLEDAQEVNQLANWVSRFERKIHDLELTRMVSIQMAPQIRLIQNNDTLMIEKIQSTINHTIPLWKNQMVIGLGMHHSQEAVQAHQQISEMTNELLKKNMESLKTSSIEIAKETERGMVDMSTLTQTNQQLITTLDEVMNIQQQGREKRKQAESELQKIETELKTKLQQIVKQ